MRVVAIVNQKGGCGKTTTAINLAAVMARDGVRSLLVDMDPQSHCAAGLGVPDQRIERTIGDAMLAENPAALSVDEFVWEVGRNLHLAPSSVTLSLLEAPNGPLTARFDRDRRLARVLAAWKDRFDWCVIDCPPTIGLLTFNALRAADLVIIPVETGYFSLKGAEKQIQTIEAVVGRFGRDIPFRLLPTLVNERRALSRDVVEALARRCPEALLPMVIHEHEELRDAASFGQSITEFAPGSAAESDFDALANWLREHAPSTRVLDDFASDGVPSIETFIAGPSASVDAVAPIAASALQPLDAPQVQREPEGGRAADVVTRLRAMNERTRQANIVGGGFGPRAQLCGTVVFSLPFSRRVSSVVGDFNDWNPATTQFIESADRRRLEATVVLAPGTHAYRIVVDGKETLDEYNNLRDENLGVNVVVVPGACSESTEFSASEDRLP
ncbi:MAG: AAA family ATPase [Planctomycetota bacterium]|jgi:chromosome partitioning protein